jgi:hypothetical protein
VGEHAGDGRWMTYGELAEARAIKRATAIRMARRYRWRKQMGNDGFARVLVPEGWDQPAPEDAPRSASLR